MSAPIVSNSHNSNAPMGSVAMQSHDLSVRMPMMAGYPIYAPHTHSAPLRSPAPSGPITSDSYNPNTQMGSVGMQIYGLPAGMPVMAGNNSGHAAYLQQLLSVGLNQEPATDQKRRFKCPQCPSAFTRKYDLNRHQKSHLNRKRFACVNCGKTSVRKDALNVSFYAST